MGYRHRYAEASLDDFAKYFKVVLVLGARQVGKSTLLAHHFPEMPTFVFDANHDLFGAQKDPDLFLAGLTQPAILDEVQFVPALLSSIKRRVDRSDDRGQYFLTGSQNLAVLKSVSESLAGRVGILHLGPLTPREMVATEPPHAWLDDFLLGRGDVPEILGATSASRATPEPGLFTTLWRGSLPGTLDLPDRLVPKYLRSYVETYLERDVRVAGDVADLVAFGRFLGLAAALTAKELNDSQAGREIGISPQTARRWYAMLSATYQWHEVPPLTRNAVKRVAQRRKGHLHDTGLACYLQRITNPEALAVSPLLGALFESWVLNALRGQFPAMGVPPDVTHWRTTGGAEVDIVLERDGKLFPIEVKCKSHPSGHDTRGLRAFRETYGTDRVGPGLVVHGGEDCWRLDENTWAVPWTRI